MQHATGSINNSSGETSTGPTALKVLTASRAGGREGGRTIGPVLSDLDVVSADPHAAIARGRVPRQHCARRRRRIRAQGSRRARWRAAHGRAIGWWRPRRGTGGVDGPDSEDMPAMPQPTSGRRATRRPGGSIGRKALLQTAQTRDLCGILEGFRDKLTCTCVGTVSGELPRAASAGT
jgi:hypothetical protein